MSYSTTRSVIKAFDLLQVMNKRPVSSVDYLYHETGISKPTIVRLLATLCDRGFVAKAPHRGAYVLTSLVKSLSDGYHSEPQIIEASGDIAIRLTKDLKWPLGIAVFERDAMVLQYSTIPYSPVSPYHSVLNRRYTMLGSALGRAYLAHCSPDERNAVIELLADSGSGREQGAVPNPEVIRHVMEFTKSSGYGLRDPSERPESYSIAVPIFDESRVIASMAVTWFRSAMRLNEAIDRFVAPMKEAASEISQSYIKLGAQTAQPQLFNSQVH